MPPSDQRTRSTRQGRTRKRRRGPESIENGAPSPIMAGLSSELLAGELAEASSGCIVRAEGLVLRVLRIGGDFLRDLPHLFRERVVMRRVLEERLDPALRPVVARHIVVEQQLPE